MTHDENYAEGRETPSSRVPLRCYYSDSDANPLDTGRFISDGESPRRDGGQPFTVEKLQEKNRGKPFERSTLVGSLFGWKERC